MPAAKPKPPTYDATTQYRVQLNTRIDVLSQTFYPGAVLTLRGDVLEGLAPGTVASAEPVNTDTDQR